jgi:c-di-GMP-binding flagellar brake protein YcgR
VVCFGFFSEDSFSQRRRARRDEGNNVVLPSEIFLAEAERTQREKRFRLDLILEIISRRGAKHAERRKKRFTLDFRG